MLHEGGLTETSEKTDLTYLHRVGLKNGMFAA